MSSMLTYTPVQTNCTGVCYGKKSYCGLDLWCGNQTFVERHWFHKLDFYENFGTQRSDGVVDCCIKMNVEET